MTVDAPRDDADDELDASDEALNWDGERDASYVAGPTPVVPKPVTSRAARSGRGAPTGSATESAAQGPTSSATELDGELAAPAPTSSFLLVTYGIIAGVFLLYTIGWFTTMRRNTYVEPSVLGSFMTVFGTVLAVVAAPIWFGSVILLTRRSKPLVRLLWLLLGVLLLVPIPFVLGM